MPTPAGFQAMRDACDAVAPDPAHFDEVAAKTEALVHEFPGWTDELRSLPVPTLLIFGHARGRDTAARRSVRVDHAVPRRALSGGHDAPAVPGPPPRRPDMSGRTGGASRRITAQIRRVSAPRQHPDARGSTPEDRVDNLGERR
jgi:hypothetical protein